MIKKIFLILVFLSVLMIQTVSATDNSTFISDDLTVKELSIEQEPDHPWSMVWEDNIKYTYNVSYENLSDEITLDSTPIVDEGKINPNFTISMINRTLDGNGTLVMMGSENMTGYIVFSFNTTEKFNLNNGTLTYQFNSLEKGIYSIGFYYSGDENYSNATYNNVRFSIPSFYTTLKPLNDNIVLYYRNGTQFVTTLKDDLNRPLKNKKIEFYINGLSYYKQTNVNGTVRFNLNLQPANYSFIATYHGSNAISGIYIMGNISVLPTLSSNNLTKYYKNQSKFFIEAIDGQGNVLVNKSIIFNINGIHYTRTTNSQGLASLNINLPNGNYIITATNTNDNYQISSNVLVLPTIDSNDLVKIYKNDSQFKVKALDKHGNPLVNVKLQFNINGVIYTKTTNSNGIASLNINLAKGNYIITTTNLNDGCSVSNNIRVSSYFFTQDLVKYYKNSSRFQAKLVDSNHNPVSDREVTFMINGATYVRHTNANGIASLNINLEPGIYSITSTCGQYSEVNQITVLNTILLPQQDSGNYRFIDWIDETPNSYYFHAGFGGYQVKILDGNGEPCLNQTVNFTMKDLDRKYIKGDEGSNVTDSNGVAKFIPSVSGVVVSSYNGYSVQQYVKVVY